MKQAQYSNRSFNVTGTDSSQSHPLRPQPNANAPASTTLQDRLEALLSNPPPGVKGDDWLRTLYSSYLQRFLSDNGRIWTTATLMVPLSLAAFAGVPALKQLTNATLALLAVPSIVLITLWLFSADKHRVFQEQSEDVLNAIEHVLGIRELGKRPKWGAVRLARWALTVGVWLGWLVLFCLYATGYLPDPESLPK